MEKQIAVSNDLVWFHQFSQHELGVSRSRLSARAANLMTGDFFGGNPFAARFNVAVAQMGEFGTRLESALHRLVLVDIYENFLDYLVSVPALLAECGRHGWSSKSAGKSPEAKFQAAWKNSGYAAIDRHHWETFTYLRLRRHHYAHAAETISERFVAHTKSVGSRLNAHWLASGKLSGAELDFTSHRIFAPGCAEIIALIRVAQAWLRTMDHAVAAELVPEKVVQCVARQRIGIAGGKAFVRNSMTVEQQARRIKSDCQDLWGLTVTQRTAAATIYSIDLARL
ncbi:MAG: hypothetical protein HYV96_14595 [Opitutae bacterium]|nr:hypothetical protein [Opitutae bacterium]